MISTTQTERRYLRTACYATYIHEIWFNETLQNIILLAKS